MPTKKKLARTKSAATIVIRHPDKMTDKGIADIANWLRRHAAYLKKYGKKAYGPRFTARFMYA